MSSSSNSSSNSSSSSDGSDVESVSGESDEEDLSMRMQQEVPKQPSSWKLMMRQMRT